MTHTTTETTGRADPVYAATLALLDRIETLTEELHRERSAQDEAFRDCKDACDKEHREFVRSAAYSETKLVQKNDAQREEIERLKAEHQSQIATLRANLADAHKELEQAIAERNALRDRLADAPETQPTTT